MKDSKSILLYHLVVSFVLQAIFVLLITLPSLEGIRNSVSEIIHLPSSVLWVTLLMIGFFLLVRRLNNLLVAPLCEIAAQTKVKNVPISFKKKSVNTEEDQLKHFIESQNRRNSDLEQEITRMEAELENVVELARISPDEHERLKAKLSKSEEIAQDYLNQISEAQKVASDLESKILELRRELKLRNRDLESLQLDLDQKPEPSEATPLTSILVEKLKTPLSLINNLSWRLAKSWADSSPTQIREGLEEISKQSQAQLEILKKYQASPEPQENRDAQ